MNDLAVGVVLRADASGFVGQMRAGEAALDKLTGAQKRAAGAATELTTATSALGSIYTGTWWTSAEKKTEALTAAQKRLTDAQKAGAQGTNAQRAAYQQIGFQLQDIAVQAQMGTSAFVILGQQGGQLAQAFALMGHGVDGAKGKFASFLSFMGGPWGIGLTVAISLGAALASALRDNADAAEAAKVGNSGLADAQSVLGQMFDLTTGKIKKQNELLILNARLTQLNLQSEAAATRANAAKIFDTSGDLSGGQIARAAAGAVLPAPFGNAVAGDYYGARANQKAVSQLERDRQAALKLQGQARNRALDSILTRSQDVDFTGLAVTREQFQQAIIDSATADAKEAIAAEMKKTLDSGELSGIFHNPGKPKKDNSAEKAAREAKRLAEFGDRAAEAIARMNDEFNAAPKEVDRARQATAQLDALIQDLGERKPPNWEALIKQAQDLKPLIQDSLQKPIRDMLDDQQKEIALGRARLTGRESEVDALQLTYQLMSKVGVESEDQLATELAKRGVTGDQIRQLYENLDVMRAQTREMEKQRAEQQAFLSAIDDVRASLHQTLADLRTRGPKAIGDMFKDLLHIADNLFADVVSEQLFGNLFRELQDQVTGADKVSKAGDKIARAVDKSATELKKFGDAVEGARNKVNGTVGTAVGSVPGASGDGIPEIVVEGKRKAPADELKKTFKGGFKEAYEDVFKNMKTQFGDLFRSIFGDKGLFSESLGKTLGTAMANAQIGATVGKGVTNALGIKGSSTGGAIGGAVGGALGSAIGGPLGQAIGSVLGGIAGSAIGGLFKKAKYGTAVVSGQGKDDVAISGNKAAAKQAASGAAGSIQAGLDQIAEAFGGAIGDYRVSIGTYKDKWRVSTTGYAGKLNFKGDTGPTGKGLTDFGKDGEAQAIAFAIADAIADGAIRGISPAVEKALKSSTDLNEAIKEALKVQEVEDLLGGIGAQLQKQFRSFEAQAKERVRIATQYGFDVVEIEKKNAEDRAKLVDSILADRVGSLRSLLDDLKYGNLFEGSATDQRNALLVEIAKAKTDAQAGIDGAAEKLADLERRLVELSRDAFGTAGSQYASDRQGAISSAEAVIAAENERVKAAQDAVAATNAKLDEANKLANEANDLTTTTNGLLAQLIAQYGSLNGAARSGAIDYSALARLYP